MKKIRIDLTEAEYKKIIGALYLASEWDKSVADSYFHSREHSANPKQKQAPEYYSNVKSAKAYMTLRAKLGGKVVKSPVEGMKTFTLSEIRRFTKMESNEKHKVFIPREELIRVLSETYTEEALDRLSYAEVKMQWAADCNYTPKTEGPLFGIPAALKKKV